MSYRNKTFVSFASEDINSYRIMKAWKSNSNIDFNFYDAHDIETGLDTSDPDAIKARLRERLANTQQVILLVGAGTRSKSARANSFIQYEIDVIKDLDIPIIFVNLNQIRASQPSRLPSDLAKTHYSISISFHPSIIQYALDKFPQEYSCNNQVNEANKKIGAYYYQDSVYSSLGI